MRSDRAAGGEELDAGGEDEETTRPSTARAVPPYRCSSPSAPPTSGPCCAPRNVGALSTDPVVQGVIAGGMTALQERMLDTTGLQGRHREIAALALAAWLSFVRTLCVQRLQTRTITRDELRQLCIGALLGAFGPVIDLVHSA